MHHGTLVAVVGCHRSAQPNIGHLKRCVGSRSKQCTRTAYDGRRPRWAAFVLGIKGKHRGRAVRDGKTGPGPSKMGPSRPEDGPASRCTERPDIPRLADLVLKGVNRCAGQPRPPRDSEGAAPRSGPAARSDCSHGQAEAQKTVACPARKRVDSATPARADMAQQTRQLKRPRQSHVQRTG